MQIINKIGILINWPREFDMYQELIKHIPNNKIEFKNEILVKVRSTGKLLNAKILFRNSEKAEVKLKIPEDGVSPGQACVFYKKDNFGFKVLGGGWVTN